ncbi:hypothetical protein TRIATDRAFT_297666 [Trichoderma atroviride IMI 206040]|uniref:Uncharacterized protein n=1 Tax=Hypocrea atroviridis (strain ATCC 20476 / IMI 206040) TaxID=452589 RepID=G9NJ30_HYPAI|nr:uncharacterized protein TRIATDRAFT_297666 [Trichoderma atroviride IMI 206040]EHK48907.1 hypothetical protein TRIATDRAFT_297666 [Trichoderma atroviride IMI 206040]
MRFVRITAFFLCWVTAFLTDRGKFYSFGFTALDPSIRPYLVSFTLRAMTLFERIYRKIRKGFEKAKRK